MVAAIVASDEGGPGAGRSGRSHERASSSRRKARPLRLFVAVHPPEETATGLLEALGRLQLPPHRVTPLEQVHLTLQFIGDTDARELSRVCETLTRACDGIPAFSLGFDGWIGLPARGPARLMAARTDAPPPLLELQRRLATRLAGRPRQRPGDRFLPHLTLCRFRDQAKDLQQLPELALRAFAVERLRLMRSRLDPKGAIHTAEHEVVLSPGSAGRSRPGGP